MVSHQILSKLKTLFEQEKQIVFSLLFGSRVEDDCINPKDWDFAVFWNFDLNFWDKLGLIEDLRNQLAKTLKIEANQIDLVDLNRGGLSISSSIVESGIPIKGEGSLVLEKYYQRIWALEEDFHWRLTVENRRISG
jgi:hypothetical protein